MFYYVYLIQSTKYLNEKYVGYTTNLKQRLETHNSGGSVYTAELRPWELISFTGFKSKYQALEFEKYLKSHAGRAFSAKRFW
jgi:putative endonuclease